MQSEIKNRKQIDCFLKLRPIAEKKIDKDRGEYGNATIILK